MSQVTSGKQPFEGLYRDQIQKEPSFDFSKLKRIAFVLCGIILIIVGASPPTCGIVLGSLKIVHIVHATALLGWLGTCFVLIPMWAFGGNMIYLGLTGNFKKTFPKIIPNVGDHAHKFNTAL